MIRTKVVMFKVSPVFILLNEENNCVGEGTSPTFSVYPGKGFNIDKTIEDIEKNLVFKDEDIYEK